MMKNSATTIAQAMQRQPRVSFLPTSQQRFAEEDRALPIGFGQTNSQPSTVVDMLRLLAVQPGQKVLDLGSGSGWTSALLGELVGPAGQVHGVELVPELVARSRNSLDKEQPWVHISQAEPGVLGLPELAPFDRILVSAEAKELPAELLAQLATSGVMVIPVAQTLLRVTHEGITRHGAYLFVPLIQRD
ncbi:protein-L-isoaspartate O-methyltransferase family protein [Corynebacterium sp. A21]|uniref:protein-L-isoaspartate O-methyltransferase family protein n=1 Tax=Corynebacterium sp. A21 TaxID=3457318 RepID=UPI003FD13028